MNNARNIHYTKFEKIVHAVFINLLSLLASTFAYISRISRKFSMCSSI